jgi:hypothetical protein
MFPPLRDFRGLRPAKTAWWPGVDSVRLERRGSEAGAGGFGAEDEGLRPLDRLSTSGSIQNKTSKAVVIVVVHLLGARLPIW